MVGRGPGLVPAGFTGGDATIPPPGDWFVAKVTSIPTAGEYEFDEWWLDGTGTFAFKDGGRVGTALNPGHAVGGATLAVGDFALARRGEGSGGNLWELVPTAGGFAGFLARLTTSSDSGGTWSPARWKYYRQTLNPSGAWVDDGSEAAAFDAVPSTIDGTNYARTPAADLRVFVFPSKQTGLYEFLPVGAAGGSLDSGTELASWGAGIWAPSLEGVYQATGLIASLPAAGTYFITYQVHASLDSNVVNALEVQMQDAAGAIDGSEVTVGQANVREGPFTNYTLPLVSLTHTFRYVASGAGDVELWGRTIATGYSFLSTAIHETRAASKQTRIDWLRVA